jgi:hypothetical protein
MKTPPSPFAWLDGRPYLVVNFQLEPSDDSQPLPTLLEGLLRHHDPEEVLLLRPLTRDERKLLLRTSSEAEIESWANMVVVTEDRLRGRDTKKRKK